MLRFSTDKENLAGDVPCSDTNAGGVRRRIIFITTIISIKLSESMIKPINSLVKQLDLRNENIGQLKRLMKNLNLS